MEKLFKVIQIALLISESIKEASGFWDMVQKFMSKFYVEETAPVEGPPPQFVEPEAEK